jgi:hypothetical protein
MLDRTVSRTGTGRADPVGLSRRKEKFIRLMIHSQRAVIAATVHRAAGPRVANDFVIHSGTLRDSITATARRHTSILVQDDKSVAPQLRCRCGIPPAPSIDRRARLHVAPPLL